MSPSFTHQNAFRFDTSCGRFRASSIDSKTGSFSRGERRLGRCCQDRHGCTPSTTVSAPPQLRPSSPSVLEGELLTAELNCHRAMPKKQSEALKFHSPTAQTICTLDFILGLFGSVTKLRLAQPLACVFLCETTTTTVVLHT